MSSTAAAIEALFALGGLFVAARLFVHLAKAPRRRFRRDFAAREPLDAETFVATYYAGTNVSADVVRRLRPLYAREFGLSPERLRPADNPRMMFDRTDDVSLIRSIEAEFEITFSGEDVAELSGTLDSLMRYVARKTSPPDSAAED